MKKWITFILIFVLALVITGCKLDDDDNGDKVINASGIEITASKTEIEIEEELQLTAKVKPDGAVQGVTWTSKNDSIATVNQNGVVKGVASGVTQIVATANSNNKIQKEINITVKTPVIVVDPESVEISGKNQVTINSNITLTATVLPANASQEVIWESSNTQIATVVNGKVTGKVVGTVTITATVAANTEIADTHEVTVVEENNDDDPVFPEQVVITGEQEMTVGTAITLLATVLPAGVNQSVTWTSNKEEFATVSASGEVSAIKVGTVYITATSIVDENVFETHKIVVKEAPFIEPYPDMEGYELLIMAAGHALYEHDPFDKDYKSLDKTAKQKAWQEVEKNFNVKLKVVAYPDEAPWGPQRVDWINAKAAIGLAEADVFVSTTEWLKTLADGNSIVDTTSFYQLYGQNQLPSSLKGASTYKGGLYALPIADAGSINVETGIFYNIALIERFDLPSPAKLFNEGKWTYNDFYEYVAAAKGVLDEGYFVVSGEPSLYWAGMVNAGGVRLMDTITLSVNISHSYSRQAVSTLKKINDIGAWDPVTAWDAQVVSFNAGLSIFQAGELWFVRTGNRWPSTLWDEGGMSRFGYVPFPYPNNVNKNDTRTTGTGGACYMMASSRPYPASVAAKDVYRAFTEMMLNTAKYMREDPTYSLDNVMSLVAQTKTDDPESVDALVFFKKDKVVFDPIDAIDPFYNSGSIGIAIRNAVLSGTDFDEATDGQLTRLQDKLLQIYG